MKKLMNMKPAWLLALYCLIDIICAGAGMGVPIFCIFAGFFFGWFIIRLEMNKTGDIRIVLKKSVGYGVILSLVTFLIMALIWGWTVALLFKPGYDFANFGHPMILFEPKASFIAWLILMVFISPFLQLLAIIFSGNLTLIYFADKNITGNPHLEIDHPSSAIPGP